MLLTDQIYEKVPTGYSLQINVSAIKQNSNTHPVIQYQSKKMNNLKTRKHYFVAT